MAAFEVRRLGEQVASALVAIHKAKLVHRDLKPSNIILGRTGPRVIDFGISRALDDSGGITSQNVRLGTPPYMAPEQFVDDVEVTTATDIFAWGGLMIFASTGRPPFGTAASQSEVAGLAFRVANRPPNLLGLEQPLRDLVRDAMDKDPSKPRPPTSCYGGSRPRTCPRRPLRSRPNRVRLWRSPSRCRPHRSVVLRAPPASGSMAV